MSDLILRVVAIDKILPYPNADKLEIIKIGGWQIVSGKGNYTVGQTAIHVLPDTLVARRLADQWGVTQYLSFSSGAQFDSSTPGGWGRVRAVKLRGETSFGFLAPNDSSAEIGTDVSRYYEVKKYEPPPPPVGMSAGNMVSEHPLFYRYTDIQNLRNFPDMLDYSEPLMVTEKIHGTQSRVGWIRASQPETLTIGNLCLVGSNGTSSHFQKVVGTHRTQRHPDDCGIYGLPFNLHKEALRKLFAWATESVAELNSLIVFGEIYGAGVQDLHYGAKQEKSYRVFDIAINGEYMTAVRMKYVCETVGLPTTPILAHGVLAYDDLLHLARGNTTLVDNHIREGIVVRPMHAENTWGRGTLDPHPKRMIFKVINEDYLTRKNGTEYH